MQAFNEDPSLILFVYALMAIPFIVAIAFFVSIATAVVHYRKGKIEKAKKASIVGVSILAVFVLFELLTGAVL